MLTQKNIYADSTPSQCMMTTEDLLKQRSAAGFEHPRFGDRAFRVPHGLWCLDNKSGNVTLLDRASISIDYIIANNKPYVKGAEKKSLNFL